MGKPSWLFSNRIRFLERCFYEHEPIYVLGHAHSGFKVKKKPKLKLKHFLEAKNLIEQDGSLDPEELERGAKILGYHHQTSQEKEEGTPEPVVKMIFRNTPPHPFVISNMKESDRVSSLNLNLYLNCLVGLLWPWEEYTS